MADGTACVDCTDDNGCVRTQDCNLCSDRLCGTCTNFDSDPSICTACIDNAITPTACECDVNYFFSEATDSCVSCHTNCAD
jgi:hypothetical protein